MTMGRGPQRVNGIDSYLVLRALDASTGEKKWEIAYNRLPSTEHACVWWRSAVDRRGSGLRVR